MESSNFFIQLKTYLPQLTDEELEKLTGISEFKTFLPKELILKSGNLQKKVFLILEGSIRGYICDDSGKIYNTLLRSKGVFVGDAESVLTDQPQKLNFEAMDHTKIMMFSITHFEQLAKEYRGIQQLYLESLKEVVLTLTNRVNSLTTMTAEERYLDLLDRKPYFLKDAFDKYIANYLGMSPVTFSRIKKKQNLK